MPKEAVITSAIFVCCLYPMNATFILREDFEVSSPALDQIVAAALEHEGCYGSRMTGAGFGGCAVALVAAHEASDFIDYVEERYFATSGRNATLYICEAADGASLVN